MRTIKEFFTSMYALPTGLYEPGNSLVHQISPAAKLLCFIVVVISVITARNLFGFLILTLVLGAIIYLTEMPLGRIFASLWRLNCLYIVIAMLVMCLYHRSGEPWKNIWILAPTTEGLWAGLRAGLRTMFIVTALNMLNVTSSSSELYFGAKRILSPLKYLKIQTEAAAAFIASILQFVPLYFDKLERIRATKVIRGTGRRERRLGRGIPSLTMVFAALKGAYIASSELRKALLMRDTEFRSKPKLKDLKLTLSDIWGLLVCVALLGLETVVF